MVAVVAGEVVAVLRARPRALEYDGDPDRLAHVEDAPVHRDQLVGPGVVAGGDLAGRVALAHDVLLDLAVRLRGHQEELVCADRAGGAGATGRAGRGGLHGREHDRGAEEGHRQRRDGAGPVEQLLRRRHRLRPAV